MYDVYTLTILYFNSTIYSSKKAKIIGRGRDPKRGRPPPPPFKREVYVEKGDEVKKRKSPISSRLHIFKHSYLCTLSILEILPCAFGVKFQDKTCTVGTSSIC